MDMDFEGDYNVYTQTQSLSTNNGHFSRPTSSRGHGKGSPEDDYGEKRRKNNVAVKKSRERTKEELEKMKKFIDPMVKDERTKETREAIEKIKAITQTLEGVGKNPPIPKKLSLEFLKQMTSPFYDDMEKARDNPKFVRTRVQQPKRGGRKPNPM